MEIERKFRIKYIPDMPSVESHRIEQWYLSYSPEKRIRIIDDSVYIVTEKSEGTLSREEKEYEVTKEEAKKLIDETRTLLPIEKVRYSFKAGELNAELDMYEGALYGIMICEFEFDSEEEARNAVLPDWIGIELTDDPRFKNAALSKKINGHR